MLIIHDQRLPKEYTGALARLFPDTQLLPFSGPAEKDGGVYGSISCHPDIYFSKVDKDTVVHAPSVSEKVLSVLERSGVKLIKGQKAPSGKYPSTAGYNAAVVGRTVLHNTHLTDRVLADAVSAFGHEFVHVAQGYAACSVVPAGRKALITSDEGISREALKNGLESLLVSRGPVSLPGEKYGFLGGASGETAAGDIVFLGDIAEHPDHRKIKDFAKKQGVKVFCLEGLPLYDGGRLLIF